MKKSISCLTLMLILGIIIPPLFAQLRQDTLRQEVEALKKRISELEGKLQIVENVEKMELAAKLAEAQAKLANVEFSKLKLELKDSNQQWLITWIIVFLAFLSAGGIALWRRLAKKMDGLIENEVNKRLTDFEGAIEKVKILEPQVRILNKEHVVSLLESSIRYHSEKSYYSKLISTYPDQALIDAFCDENLALSVKHETIQYLENRDPIQCVVPALDFLNLVINTDRYMEDDYNSRDSLREILKFIGRIKTQEAYDGLKHFLNRLPKEKSIYTEWFLPSNVYSLANLGIELKIKDAVEMLRDVVFDLMELKPDEIVLLTLARYFDEFEEKEGISKIVEHLEADELPNVRTECTKLLEHDNSNNTESEGSNETKPTN